MISRTNKPPKTKWYLMINSINKHNNSISLVNKIFLIKFKHSYKHNRIINITTINLSRIFQTTFRILEINFLINNKPSISSSNSSYKTNIKIIKTNNLMLILNYYLIFQTSINNFSNNKVNFNNLFKTLPTKHFLYLRVLLQVLLIALAIPPCIIFKLFIHKQRALCLKN